MVPLAHIIGWTASVINGKYSGLCISHDFTQISQYYFCHANNKFRCQAGSVEWNIIPILDQVGCKEWM